MKHDQSCSRNFSMSELSHSLLENGRQSVERIKMHASRHLGIDLHIFQALGPKCTHNTTLKYSCQSRAIAAERSRRWML